MNEKYYMHPTHCGCSACRPMTAYELKLRELASRHDCDICGRPHARPYDGTSIIDGSPIVAYHCRKCQSEIEEANETFTERPQVDWSNCFK